MPSGDHASEDHDPFVGRKLASGKLTIEECVGVGGAGTVYRARHRDLQMHVAVKVMHEQYQRDAAFCRRFQAEALSASRLDQANLTRVLDFGQEPDGLLYLAMEFLAGESLRSVIEREKRLDFARVAQIMIQVCSGLTHAHARTIIHRDIKPENLVLVRGLDDDGRETEIVKVCDFGIAHSTTAEAAAEFAGTAEYISPEQLMGDEPDAQSDVYACGVVLYELLTGVVPFEGEFPGITKKVLLGTPEPPSAHVAVLDARIDRLVLKAIAKDREIRHASVRELRSDLKDTAEALALFSAGGYWDGVTGAVGGTGRTSARPTVAPSDGTPDWLEREPAVLASMLPGAMSAPPASHRGQSPSSGAPASTSTDRMRAVRSSQTSLSSVRPAAAPPRTTSEAPASLRGSIIAGSHISMTPQASSDEEGVLAAVEKFARGLSTTSDPERFRASVSTLEPKIRGLIEKGHLTAAYRLCRVLDAIAREPHGLASRADHAQRALEVFTDREVLMDLANKALDVFQDRDGSARKIVARAGNAGAHALYTARVSHTVFEARERFVTTLQEIGSAGTPTIKAALERLETRLDVAGALWLAEDLLKAVPETKHEELGHVIARYAKSQAPSLALLATTVLPKVWGLRARPALVAQLHHRDDEVVVAAIKQLRQIGGIDSEVLSHLRPLVMSTSGGRPNVRIAVVGSLVDATTDALPAARTLLAEALEASQGNSPDVEDMVVSISNAIVATDGDVTLVALRWKKSVGFLRTRLEAVLRKANVDSVPPRQG